MREMTQLASDYGRYGYRRITALLRANGWRVNHKRIERLWRREGLKVPWKQPKWKRLWLADGSCVRSRSTHKDHVWSYDFVMDRTAEDRSIRMLTLIDEHTRECLAIDVARSLKHSDVLERLSDSFVRRGVPRYICSDNGSEFTAKAVREWLEKVGVQTLFIEPGSPWENGCIENFNGKLSDELLAREQFDTLLEAKVLIERWRKHYNTVRPHSSLGYRPPAPQAIQPLRFLPATPTESGVTHPPFLGPVAVRDISVILHFEGGPRAMPRKRYTEEQIAFAIRQHESGTSVAEIVRKMGISEQTFYRWKKKYAGMGVAEVRKLKSLEEENKKLKQLVADLALDKKMLQDVVQGKV